MLEVSHLSKIYKTKGGEDVRALDDVSVLFPEMGMVFLLGKSGSGKSTLLNVCGGLDNPTSGEIIVKGRSSKNFSQSDFDSYRNTFIGFIFQEYNILNEFSVEDNIALALELQGKPKDKEAIAALLEQVDLTGYAKRKPNTLSGGQKQRIAIARALIKAPEIIMADEPTGALDSNTGKQVFDTLKKLSKDKLVIVVSHDREFAEQYGDRVIELKDGKILSDVSKTHEEQVSISDNVTAVGDTICIKKGADLTDADFKEIKAFMKKADRDLIIASGEKDVKSFKEVARINDEGQKEVFRSTDESTFTKKAYTSEDSKFIRSKLPMRHAMKIGVSGLKTKPFRLFFTIMLCTMAFVLFGLFSTITFYDSGATLKQTLKDSELSSVRLVKEYQVHQKQYHNGSLEYEYENEYTAAFTKEEVDAYAQIYGQETFGAIKIESSTSFPVQTQSKYWKASLNYFAYLPETHPMRSKITIGAHPQADDEIAVSSYTANVIKECKLIGSNKEINSLDDVKGEILSFNGEDMKIVGIFETAQVPEKYDDLKENSDNYSLMNGLEKELQDGSYLLAFLSETAFERVAQNNRSYYGNTSAFDNKSMQVAYQNEEGEWSSYGDSWNGAYAAISQKSANETAYFLDADKTALSDNEAIVTPSVLYNSLNGNRSYQEKKLAAENEYNAARQGFYDRLSALNVENVSTMVEQWEYNNEIFIPDENEPELLAIYNDWKTEYDKKIVFENFRLDLERFSRGYEWNEETGEDVYYSDEKLSEMATKLLAFIREHQLSFSYKAQLYNNQYGGGALGNENTFTVAGFFRNQEDSYSAHMYLSDEKATELWEVQKLSYEYYSEQTTSYVPQKNELYGTIFLPYDHSDALTEKLVEIYKNDGFDESDTRISLECSIISGFEMADSMISNLSKVFLYVGLVMAVFAALLLSNFIAVSISHKKKEIGILRAVGARSFDVFKIFFSESFTITAICVVLGIVGSVLLCNVLNAEIVGMIGASLFVFGISSLLVLLGVALLTSLLATFLPVWNAAKKKPVESIRAL